METQAPGLPDALVGTATIDLEDRFHHPTFSEMMRRYSHGAAPALELPVESVELHRPQSFLPCGRLRMWVEVMRKDVANGVHIVNLGNTRLQQVQVEDVHHQNNLSYLCNRVTDA